MSIFYRHKKTAIILTETEFEEEHILPKAEEYYISDDENIFMDFLNSELDWNDLKQGFWEYCYDKSMEILLYEWEKIEISDHFPHNNEIEVEDVPLEM